MAARRGFFISFEGLDGAGKSTQVAALGAALRSGGYDVITVRPNDTPLGELISGVVLQHQRSAALQSWTEALLFNAGRVQLLAEVILPALEAGTVVVADRFVDSTLAYQGGGRGLDESALLRLHQSCCGGILPDLTVYLELGMDAAARRQRAEQLPLDRIEGAPTDFHARVRATFERLADESPERIVRVDASATATAISQHISSIVERRLEAAGLTPAVPAR